MDQNSSKIAQHDWENGIGVYMKALHESIEEVAREAGVTLVGVFVCSFTTVPSTSGARSLYIILRNYIIFPTVLDNPLSANMEKKVRFTPGKAVRNEFAKTGVR